MDNFILKMNKITKVYNNGVVANKDIEFSLREGEIHALVGENGAGKSTLMKILFGMEKPTSGEIILNGNQIEMSSSKDAINLGIGMVHQHFMLVPSFSVAQNIYLGMEPKQNLFIDEEKAIQMTNELGKKYNLEVDATKKVSELSVGMMQRVEILKALARGAKILILDEPTAVLTPQETELLFKELVNLKNQGHTIVFISHKLKEVKAITDRITIMRNGRFEGVFDTKDVTEQEISNKMVGRDVVLKYDKNPTKLGQEKLRVKNIDYIVDDRYLLKNINFSVKEGQIVGIAGVEGNGQRELIEIITRDRSATNGDVVINGENISKKTIRELRDSSFGFIPEDRIGQGSAGEASIKDNLISNQFHTNKFIKNGLLDYKKIDELAKEWIKIFKIKCFSGDQNIDMLSGGNMQKVVVARECAIDPKMLIVEQPTRGVDIGAGRFIHEKLLELRDNGCSILLMSADLNEVMELSDSLLVMYEGEIVAYFKDTKNLTEEELGLCMLGLKRHDEETLRRAIDE